MWDSWLDIFMRNVITHELLENSWVYIFDEYWFMGQEAILLRYGSHSKRQTGIPRVDGYSTDTPGLGRHTLSCFFHKVVVML